ncbi:NRDE family protein [Pusillimonas sp. ANT_WB101]|uniref:NRDE family protein n=1 Tax=Pusillimonas sp. ANT_WB101 TaxID=2597356 RepID=UPI0011ED5D36|nr:NRDE family protein [Pusillimonas sp. ANT_WB101]KAA0910869.1 NRDE family protein [Pusillimonas sp. ANT_WB101]
MCIAYLAIGTHPDWPLFIAANRDEFHHRPTVPARPDTLGPGIIAGIDLQGQGSWLGMTKQGRYALITNYRDPARLIPDAPTRGQLVSRFLQSDMTPQAYAGQVQRGSQAYNGFNLIVGDLHDARYVGNRTGQAQPVSLEPGRYVLSNHLLDTPWPKAQRLRNALDAFPVNMLERSLTEVFEILQDETTARDDMLPRTGLSLERERLLSSPFIVSAEYGTRCSTVIAVHASGQALFSEVSYTPAGTIARRHDWPCDICPQETSDHQVASSTHN